MAKAKYRFIQLDRAKIDDKARTVQIAFSSETPVARSERGIGDFMEVLSHDPKHVDLARLRDGAPLLLGHDPDKQIGIVESALIGEDKVGRAIVRFSESQLGQEIFNDVKSGIRRHISVGYEPQDIIEDTEDEERKLRTIKFSWMPYEVSSVSIPADATVGVGRARSLSKKATKRNMAQDECCGYLYNVETILVALFEDCEEDAMCSLLSQGITSVSVALKGLQYWSTKTSADCVVICQNTAATLKEVMAGMEAVDCSEDDCDALECAIEKLIENAGGEVVVTTTTAAREKENQVQLDKTTLTESIEITSPEKNMNRILLEATPAGGGGEKTPTTKELRDAEISRIREITATVDLLVKDHPGAAEKFRAKQTEAINSDMDLRDFKASMLQEIPGAKIANQRTLADVVNGDKTAIENYSVSRAIQSCLLRKSHLPDGLEGEVHDAMAKRAPAEAAGFQVPFDAMISRGKGRRGQRDLNANTFSQGGAFIQTSIYTPIIELLRNRMVCDRMGVQGMAGLEGNVAIPRQSGATTAYSLPEQATLTKSTQALDQIVLTPHRVGAYNSYSRQLLLQSSVDVENFLRDDLLKVIAIKWDYLILQGQGAGSEPTGILNTTGIGSITFGGVATWANVVAFETQLALANADLGNMAYVTSPGVRGRWKVIAKTGVGVTSVVPIFLWDKGGFADGSTDGEVNSYRAAATNQILNNLVFFGNWEDTIHALWGGYDIIVDPFTQATDGTNRVTVNTFGDVAVRHAASYCVSSDSGAQ